jgi:hypothetical protein
VLGDRLLTSDTDSTGTNRATPVFMRSKATAPLFATLLVLSIVMSACEDKSPTTPGPTQIEVTGRWAADITVQTIPTRMTWTLMQSGSAVTGPVLVGLANGSVLLNGLLTGTLTGSSLAYTITVGPGGIPSQPTCTGQLGGTMAVTFGVTSSMVGPMSLVSSNCALQLPSTNITLIKQ